MSHDSSRQIDLLVEVDYEKLERLDRTVDGFRKRFGNDVIKRASFVKAPDNKSKFIDHMSGGISREKRTVNYEEEKIL